MADQNSYLWKDKKHHLWFPISFTTYYIEDDRLMIKQGLLNTTLDETLLYRIVDLTFHQTFGGKIFGTGDIILKTKVDATPEIVLKNIKRPMEVRRFLSQAIEECRQSRNVVGKEFYGGPAHEHTDADDAGFCDLDHRPM